MNIMNTKFENRFVYKEIAIGVSLFMGSFGMQGLALAQSDVSTPLPVLVDPAGILDPEMLSILNGLYQESVPTADGVVVQGAADTAVAGEPAVAAAKPVQGNDKQDNAIAGTVSSIIDPTPALKENGLFDSSTTTSDFGFAPTLGLKVKAAEAGAVDTPTVDDRFANLETTLNDEGLPILTFADMLALSLVDSPSIVMADERVLQAVEQSKQVGAFRYPTIAMTSSVGPERNDPVTSEDSGVANTIGKNVKVTLTKQLYDGGTARSNYIRTNKLIGAAEAESQLELESLLLDIVINYVDYWRYQVELEQAIKFVSVMNELVGDLDSMYKAGATSKLEVDFARARVASARGAESNASAAMNNAFSELEYLVPGLVEFAANSPAQFSDFTLLSHQEYIDKGAVSNSGFVINKMNIDATELKIRAAKGLLKPSVDVELSGSYIDDEGQETERRLKAAAKLLLNYTLYSGGERRAGIRRAESQLREFESERTLLERDVFREIDQSYNSITASRLALDAVNDEIVAHEELQRLNRQNLAFGTVNIMELIDVEERLFSANSRQSEVLATMYQEYFTLLVAAGFTEEVLAKYELELASAEAQ